MKINFDRIAVMSITLFLFIVIFVASDKFNFLSYTSEPPVINLQKEKINQIVIDDGRKTIDILQQNNIWLVEKNNLLYQADQVRVNNLLTAVSNIKKDTLVSKLNPTQYGIGKQKVTLISPDKIYVLYIGNTSVGSTHYVKIGDQPEIVTAEGLDTAFSPDDYRDLSPNLVRDENLVSSVEVNHDSTSFKLESIKDDWFIDGKKVPQERVSFFLNDLKTVQADDIVKSDQELPAPDLTLSVTEDNQMKQIDCYAIGTDYYLKVPGKNELFKLKLDDIAMFKKTPDDFLKS